MVAHLIQYRVVQHPYLHDDKIEDRSLGPVEVHNKMVAASAKLRFLKLLLPKLKDRGHRVLLFSQVSGFCDLYTVLSTRSPVQNSFEHH